VLEDHVDGLERCDLGELVAVDVGQDDVGGEDLEDVRTETGQRLGDEFGALPLEQDDLEGVDLGDRLDRVGQWGPPDRGRKLEGGMVRFEGDQARHPLDRLVGGPIEPHDEGRDGDLLQDRSSRTRDRVPDPIEGAVPEGLRVHLEHEVLRTEPVELQPRPKLRREGRKPAGEIEGADRCVEDPRRVPP